MNASRRSRSAPWFLLALVACQRGATSDRAAPAVAPTPVALTSVVVEELPRKVAVTGVLAAQEVLVLGLEVAGRLRTLSVDVGDLVDEGAVIAALEPREFELAVQHAQAQLVAIEARLGLPPGADLEGVDIETLATVREAKAVVVEATQQRDRVAAMVQEKMQPESALETAAAALTVAESRQQQARDQARTWLAEARLSRIECLQAEKRRDDSLVRAPWRGRVAVRHVAAGQVLSAGAPIVTLLRVDPLRLQLRVPDRLATDAAIGQSVEFTVDGMTGQTRSGRIVRAGPAIERGDRTRLLEAAIDNQDGALLPGGFCRALIVTSEGAAALVVPKKAVVSFAGVHRVFQVGTGKDGQTIAKGVIVELGRDLGERVELLRGPAAGERVIAAAIGLSPDVAIRVGD